jgi:hypothetical protein
MCQPSVVGADVIDTWTSLANVIVECNISTLKAVIAVPFEPYACKAASNRERFVVVITSLLINDDDGCHFTDSGKWNIVTFHDYHTYSANSQATSQKFENTS